MSINVYKHFNVLIKACFKCVFVLWFIGEIRSNGRINEEVKLQKELAYLFCTYACFLILGFFLYPLYDIYYLIVVNMSIEILNIICCLIFFLI